MKPRTLTAADLLAFLRLPPLGRRPCVVVLDNVSIHITHAIRDVRRRDVHLVYLQTYSPELNDVEHLLGILKQHEFTARACATVPSVVGAV